MTKPQKDDLTPQQQKRWGELFMKDARENGEGGWTQKLGVALGHVYKDLLATDIGAEEATKRIQDNRRCFVFGILQGRDDYDDMINDLREAVGLPTITNSTDV